jgi:hypothetical protein
MMDIDEIVRRLAANAEAIRALLEPISEDQAEWKPGPDVWSMKEVMIHVYNEERIDFRKHLKEMLAEPPNPWSAFRREELIDPGTFEQALEDFLTERAVSIAWLRELRSPNWDISVEARFGPEEVLVMRAGDVLVSWVEHDYLHLRQMNEVLHAWNVQQAKPYSTRYAGGW